MGVPLGVASKWAGHSNVQITAAIYLSVGVDDSMELMGRLWTPPALAAAPGDR
jgi:hypothetical protein